MTKDCYRGIVLYFEPKPDLETGVNQVIPIVGMRENDLKEFEIYSSYSLREILTRYKTLSEDGLNNIREICSKDFVSRMETQNQHIISQMDTELEAWGYDSDNKSYILMDILEGNVIENMKKILNPSVMDEVKFVKKN